MSRLKFSRAALIGMLTAVQIFSMVSLPAAAVARQEDAPEQQRRPQKGVERYLRRHERLKLNTENVIEEVRGRGRLTIAAESQTFDLELVPHELRALNYRAVDVGADGVAREVKRGRAQTYRGRTTGTGDEARFTVDENKIEGVIITPGEKFFVEPLKKYEPQAAANDFVLYKGSDVYATGPDECGITLQAEAEQAFQKFSSSPSDIGVVREAAESYREVEIATDADYEYVTALGGEAAANNEILSILNQIEGIYKAELGLSFKVTHQHTWTTANDPYTVANADQLLDQVSNWWNANQQSVPRDLVHMWTGRDVFNGANNYNTVGTANSQLITNGVTSQGIICRARQFAYGLSERLTDAASKVRVTAHEIGHNFGASHAVGQTACNNTIMSAVGGSATQSTFCQFSRDEITSYVAANGGCLTTVTTSNNNPNPIDDPATFVRQQYQDFLNRQPDGPGLTYWTNEINNCNGNPTCVDAKRVNTSGAFFLSTEFQSTGYFVYRLYKGAFGRAPQFAEFAGDQPLVAAGIIVNNALSDQIIETNKNAFINEFITRTAFRTIYDGLSNQGFVDELFNRTGVANFATERSALVSGLNTGAETRASVLRKVLDGTTTVNSGTLQFTNPYGKAFYEKEFNAAFVTMQYLGYLRRDGDAAGFQFWLAKLNQYGNFIDAEMVRSFIVSDEYRRRFGTP